MGFQAEARSSAPWRRSEATPTTFAARAVGLESLEGSSAQGDRDQRPRPDFHLVLLVAELDGDRARLPGT